MKMGSAGSKTVATARLGGTAANASSQLEHCQSPLGTVSLVENQDAGWYTILRNEYKLPPTANLLRSVDPAVQLLHRGRAWRGRHGAMARERQLMGSGEMRGGSNLARARMVASDYGMSPRSSSATTTPAALAACLAA